MKILILHLDLHKEKMCTKEYSDGLTLSHTGTKNGEIILEQVRLVQKATKISLKRSGNPAQNLDVPRQIVKIQSQVSNRI